MKRFTLPLMSSAAGSFGGTCDLPGSVSGDASTGSGLWTFE